MTSILGGWGSAYFGAHDFDADKAALRPELFIARGLVARAGGGVDALPQYLAEAESIAGRLAAAVQVKERLPAPERRAGPNAKARDARPRPRRRTWTRAQQRAVQIAFAPHKDYHAWTMGKAAAVLGEHGVSVVMIDSTATHRDEGARARIRASDVPSIAYNNYRLGDFAPRAVVVMNDWEPQIRALVDDANASGIATVGLIEGVQDFTDADIARSRRPYRRVSHVFLAGAFDAQFFDASTSTRVVGVPRLDELKEETATFPDEPVVVVNSNFSYGVLTDHRDSWLRSVDRACKKLGVPMIVSRHPADDGDFSRYTVTELTMYDAIRQGSVFVSRFGSGIIEALVMGKPSVYHNPHGEKVIKFGEPLGAYAVTTNVDSLSKALERELADRSDRRPRARAFLDLHVGWSDPRSSTERLVEALLAVAQLADRSPAEAD